MTSKVRTLVVKYDFGERDGEVPHDLSSVFGFVIQSISF